MADDVSAQAAADGLRKLKPMLDALGAVSAYLEHIGSIDQAMVEANQRITSKQDQEARAAASLAEAEEKVKVRHDCYRELARAAGYNGDTSEHADVMAWAEDHRNALATADVRYNELARAAGYPRDIVGHVDVLEWVRSRRREGVA